MCDKTDLQIENMALYQRNCLEEEGLSVMAGSSNTAALNVQKSTCLVLGGGDLCFSFGDMCYLGWFQSQSESSLERMPVTASSMSVFFHCSAHGQYSRVRGSF